MSSSEYFCDNKYCVLRLIQCFYLIKELIRNKQTVFDCEVTQNILCPHTTPHPNDWIRIVFNVIQVKRILRSSHHCVSIYGIS